MTPVAVRRAPAARPRADKVRTRLPAAPAPRHAALAPAGPAMRDLLAPRAGPMDAAWSSAELTPAFLQLQAAAGNQAVSLLVQRCGDHPCDCGGGDDVPVQRSWLDDAWHTVSAAVGDADAARKALTLAEAALTNPGRIPALLVEMEWESLPPPVKALVVNRLLDACRALITDIPAAIDPYVPSGLVISPLFVRAATGFLDRAASYDDEKKVQVVNRFVSLWAHPSADLTIGFLEGLVLGLWDGITGPFVLIWDLVKLQWGVTQAEARFVAMLADDSKRKLFFADVERTWAGLEPRVAAAVQQLLASQTDPTIFIDLLDKLMQALLAGAESAGGSLADGLVAYINQPDKVLGKSIGRIEGNILFQVLLIVLTAGGWAALSAAIEGIEWVADALEALQNAGRAIEGFVAASEAFARFSTFLRESKVLSELVDVLEGAFALFIKYLKFSYGIEGAEERAAGELGSMSAEQAVEAEVARGAHPTPGEGGHEIFDTAEGCAVCSFPCEWLQSKYRAELGQPGPEGEEFREELERIAGLTPYSEERLAAEKALQQRLERARRLGPPDPALIRSLVGKTGREAMGEVRFTGLARNRELTTMTDAEIRAAFEGTPYTPSSHTVMRLRDPRTPALGIHTLRDLEGLLNNGVITQSGERAIAISSGNFSMIVNPKSGILITLTPA